MCMRPLHRGPLSPSPGSLPCPPRPPTVDVVVVLVGRAVFSLLRRRFTMTHIATPTASTANAPMMAPTITAGDVDDDDVVVDVVGVVGIDAGAGVGDTKESFLHSMVPVPVSTQSQDLGAGRRCRFREFKHLGTTRS